MGRFLVSARGLPPASVDAGNWLAALGLGLDKLGVVAELHRLACEVLPNGTVIARDVSAGAAFVVRPAADEAAESTAAAAPSPSRGDRPFFAEPTDAVAGFEPPPEAPPGTPEEVDTVVDEENPESDDVDPELLARLRGEDEGAREQDERSVEELFETTDDASSEDDDDDELEDQPSDEESELEAEPATDDGHSWLDDPAGVHAGADEDDPPEEELDDEPHGAPDDGRAPRSPEGNEVVHEALETLEALDDSPHVAMAFGAVVHAPGEEPMSEDQDIADELADDPALDDLERETDEVDEEVEDREVVELLELIREAPSDLVAWQAALDVAATLVPSEAGSALRQEPDGGVRFVGVRGPEAHRLAAIKLPRGTGIVGFCLERVVSLIVHDPKNDPRFFKAMDEVTNFTTRGVLCVPVAIEGETYGCIELVNPPPGGTFNRTHLELVELVAGALAERLVTGRSPS